MTNKTIYLSDYKVPNFLVKSLDLNFDLYDDETLVTSSAHYYKNPHSSDDNTLTLDGEEHEIVSIMVDGQDFKDYTSDEHTLTLNNLPDNCEINISTKIHPELNTQLEWLYKSGGKFTTQCESQWFRKITYYMDRPDVMTVFTTRITADKKNYPILLSNGNKIDSGDLDNNRHFVTWEDPFKKPAYLFALVAGDLDQIEDSFTTMSGRDIKLQIFTESKNIDKVPFAMDSLKRSMKWDEDRFGREYDLDLFMIVAVDDFNHGAMENKWLNIFNSEAIFATPETNTDAEHIYVERVVAHEYFHNWTWNRVTCRDWFQLSLKEGLTVFRDSEFTADMHSRSVKRVEDVRLLRDYQFKEDASPMAHPIRPASFEEIRNFYTMTVYEKGAEVIKMYQTILWVDGFRKGMDLYFDRHDGQAVTTEDFLAAMADANDVDLSQFALWYSQAGTPEVSVKTSYDSDAQTYTMEFTQSCPETPETKSKKPFVIPVKYGLLDKNGQELEYGMITLDDTENTFVLENIESEPIPSLLRDFSAPVNLKYDYSHSDYAFLMQHDTDEFNRFEAAQRFALEILIDNINNVSTSISQDFINAFSVLLTDKNLDNSLRAEAIILPSETMITETLAENIDPVAIYNAREDMSRMLAEKFETEFRSIYNSLNTDTDYKLEAKDIGDRKLKNVALKYLSSLGDIALANDQYHSANNMTDVMWALSCLVSSQNDYKQAALDDFYDKWKDDTNVINKWFKLQAMSSADDTLTVIQNLEQHNLFDMTNPNKIRSLLTCFAMWNNKHFHAVDGSGYELIADKVIALNTINSQVWSRLAKAMINWKQLESTRSKLLKAQLERILETPDLSNDIAEVVRKAVEV